MDSAIIMVVLTLILLLMAASVRSDSMDSRTLSMAVRVSHDPDISFIVLQVPEDGLVDDSVQVPLSAYRGKTLKRTLYVWIEDQDGKRVTDRHKFSLNTRFMFYSMTAVLNFSAHLQDRDYTVVAEGLDVREEMPLALDFRKVENRESGRDSSGDGLIGEEKNEKISFMILDVPEAVQPNTSFKVRVFAENPTEEDLTFDAWAYVYRSSRSYSGERESNRDTFNLMSSSEVTFDLEISVDAPEGDYSLMVKILRSDRKTPVELNRDISVLAGARDVKLIRKLDDAVDDRVSDEVKRTLFYSGDSGDGMSGELIYESSSAKARRLIGFLFIICLVLVLAALALKRFWPK